MIELLDGSTPAIALDTATLNAVTDGIYVPNHDRIGVAILDAGGTHATHVVTMEVSADGSTWFSTAHTQTGLGVLAEALDLALHWVRFKTTTIEASSAVSIYLQGKT